MFNLDVFCPGTCEVSVFFFQTSNLHVHFFTPVIQIEC